MGRRDKIRGKGSKGSSIENLQADLHAQQRNRRGSGQSGDEAPGRSETVGNRSLADSSLLSLGRLARGGTLRAVQDRIISDAGQFGFQADGLYVVPSVIFINSARLGMIRTKRQEPVPRGIRELYSIVSGQNRSRGQDALALDADLDLDGPFVLDSFRMGAAYDPRKRSAVTLAVPPNTELEHERLAVLSAVYPGGRVPEYEQTSRLMLRLASVRQVGSDDYMTEFQQHISDTALTPSSITLGHVDVFDGSAVGIGPNS